MSGIEVKSSVEDEAKVSVPHSHAAPPDSEGFKHEGNSTSSSKTETDTEFQKRKTILQQILAINKLPGM